jgi:histidine triad (HIT) family protein
MCIFCEIVNKTKPSTIVYEDDFVMAFLDINPISKGHTLIIPKKHYETFDEMDEKTSIHMFSSIKKIISLYKDKYKMDGYNLICSNGREAQQEIFHVHIHLIPRYKEDKLKINFS